MKLFGIQIGRKPLPPETGKVWRQWEHTGWGNNIQVQQDEGTRVRWVGWTWTPPQIGDVIEVRTVGSRVGTSGNARLLITHVDRVRDPDDMWFADSVRIADAETGS
ncbi:MAG: hypothetical protein AB1925_12700 [Actinomycetota bacterium]